MDIAVPSQAKNKNKYANCKYRWTVFLCENRSVRN